MIGHEFEIEVIVKNIKRKRAIRTIKHLQIVVDSIKYTGDGRKNIAKQSFDDIRLDFNEGIYVLCLNILLVMKKSYNSDEQLLLQIANTNNHFSP